jgi:RNA polymerase sigma-70 factor, ECF subfamily
LPLPVVGAQQAEIERLYRERYAQFRNALACVTRNRDSARDAVQHAFAEALANRADFRGEGSLAAWVWKIALRHAVRSRDAVPYADLNGDLDPQLPEPERDLALADALRRLPPRRRLIVFLRYFGDLSYLEIAEVTGLSEGTVAASLAQARAALKETLTEGVKVDG